MDDGAQEPLKKTRLLAWLTACLLAAGVASAGVVNGDHDAAQRRIVTAAGEEADGVELATTVEEFRSDGPAVPAGVMLTVQNGHPMAVV